MYSFIRWYPYWNESKYSKQTNNQSPQLSVVFMWQTFLLILGSWMQMVSLLYNHFHLAEIPIQSSLVSRHVLLEQTEVFAFQRLHPWNALNHSQVLFSGPVCLQHTWETTKHQQWAKWSIGSVHSNFYLLSYVRNLDAVNKREGSQLCLKNQQRGNWRHVFIYLHGKCLSLLNLSNVRRLLKNIGSVHNRQPICHQVTVNFWI